MINQFVMIVFFGALGGVDIDHVIFPYRAECDYAAEKINAEVPDAKAFCFDVRVAGDRHEDSYTQSN
jgi:hypothetical protein